VDDNAPGVVAQGRVPSAAGNLRIEKVESAEQSCHGSHDCSQSGESASGPPALRPPSEQGGLALAERHQLAWKIAERRINALRSDRGS